MTKEELSSSSNIVKLPFTTLMYATFGTKDVMFNKPFENIKDVQDFIIWLVRNEVNDVSIKTLDGIELSQDECVGKDHFILSQEAINLCLGALKAFKPEARVLFTEGTEAQVSLILNKGIKTA